MKRRTTHNDVINEYKEIGFEMEFSDFNNVIKLGDMTDDYIQEKIERLTKLGLTDSTPYRLAWFNVFNDVMMKRRIIKLNILKENICLQKKN